MLYKLRDAIQVIIWISCHACEIFFTETACYRDPFVINSQIYPTTAFPLSSSILVYAACAEIQTYGDKNSY